MQASKTTATEATHAAATTTEKTLAQQAAQAASKPATTVVLTEAEIAAVTADVEAQVAAEAQAAVDAAASKQAAQTSATQTTKAPAAQAFTPATQAPATQAKPATKPATQPATTVPQQVAETTTETELAVAVIAEAEKGTLASQIVKKSPTRMLLEKQSTPELFRSKRTFEELIREHTQKLADYIKDPDAFDNKGMLQNISLELRTTRINGRTGALKTQIANQSEKLREAINILQERGAL